MIELPVVWVIVALFILVVMWAEGFISGKADLFPIIERFHSRYPNTYKLLLLLGMMLWPIVLIMVVSWGVSHLIWSFCMIFVRACQEIYEMVSTR